ncbi:MAG: helix-turn-helix transcriptional regulator [Gemmatimonadaceae bacterium]|nr:helix-turn-helix transcriptional regulator [Gemmatimonadaceae bacterium]
MARSQTSVSAIAAALRAGRIARGLTIQALAERAEVSPRLVSEFERGVRPHVSLETALRLLALAQVPLTLTASAASDRASRAAERRRTWTGWQGTLADQGASSAPSTHGDGLVAVAAASRLAVGLKNAVRRSAR